MTANPTSPAVRRPLRTAVRAAALGVTAAAVTNATPVAAAPPDSWVEADPVSPMNFLLVLAIIPLGLAAVISLLALLPSMTRAHATYQPGLAWRHEPEWFGGRRELKGDGDAQKAVAASSSGSQESAESRERGGASARW